MAYCGLNLMWNCCLCPNDPLADVCISQGLLGGLSNVVECLRGEGAPPPAVKAVVFASLHYVDAELLNALVLRRDCCSISAIKALQVNRSAPFAVPYHIGLAVGHGHTANTCLVHNSCIKQQLLKLAAMSC